MTLFVVVAALMAALAASAVAVPLLRHRQSRLVGAAAGVLVVAAAAGLYPMWSNWNWHSSGQNPAAGPDVAAMVAKLETHLREDPNDLKGWLMLGRSYIALERLDDAIVAYDHSHRLDAGNAEAALGLGEAMSLRAGGNITPEAAKLFEEALALEPTSPKALLYGGFAAAARGDITAARNRWLVLKEMHPPAQIEQLLDARIAELGPAAAGSSPQQAGSTPQQAGNSPGQAASDAEVSVNIRIAPAIKARLIREVPLFVFAREQGVQGPPLAAKRLTSAAIGTQIHLSAADSMMPGRVLTKGRRVSVTARVSFSGQPLPAAGDLYGELTYDVGQDGTRDLLIDRIAD
ncbi:MAG: cytochrome c-type biosis protein CcmH [Gammaproteobacteria bacterium]|jgi:cytochrome c-type biogenesis protein CcmH|nr:cytochrome c-type biosis protein CcmH [Gammaproteobacteria bacterium]